MKLSTLAWLGVLGVGGFVAYKKFLAPKAGGTVSPTDAKNAAKR